MRVILYMPRDNHPAFFAHWIKMKEGATDQDVLRFFERAGTSGPIPVFSNRADDALRFVDDEMAKHVSERIAEQNPDLARHLYVIPASYIMSNEGFMLLRLFYSRMSDQDEFFTEHAGRWKARGHMRFKALWRAHEAVL